MSLQTSPGPKCKGYKKQPLTQKEKDLIVRKHNELRGMVANGQEYKGTPGPQPRASNMAELVSIGSSAKNILSSHSFIC
jgi:hypothetical protein